MCHTTLSQSHMAVSQLPQNLILSSSQLGWKLTHPMNPLDHNPQYCVCCSAPYARGWEAGDATQSLKIKVYKQPSATRALLPTIPQSITFTARQDMTIHELYLKVHSRLPTQNPLHVTLTLSGPNSRELLPGSTSPIEWLKSSSNDTTLSMQMTVRLLEHVEKPTPARSTSKPGLDESSFGSKLRPLCGHNECPPPRYSVYGLATAAAHEDTVNFEAKLSAQQIIDARGPPPTYDQAVVVPTTPPQ